VVFVRCDLVAKGIIEATKLVDVSVPIIVRLDGTNAEEAIKLLKDSEMQFIIATDLAEAASKAIEVAKETVQ